MDNAKPYSKNSILDSILEPRHICFIVNPHAGTNIQSRIEEAVDKNLNHQRFVYAIWFTERAGHGAELAKKAIREGYTIIVAVGGDGSINEIGHALLHEDVCMGIIPAGSGNGLAMHLGYGRDIDVAVQKLNRAEEIEIDCGILNGRPFFNVAGIGFDGKVSNMMRTSKRRGFIGYFINSFKAAFKEVSIPFKIITQNKTMEEACFAISIANGPMYGYNMLIAPDAKLDDGVFSVVLIKKALKVNYLRAVFSALFGNIYKHTFVEHFETEALRIEFEGEQSIHLDGEGFMAKDSIELSIIPKCLRVLRPSRHKV